MAYADRNGLPRKGPAKTQVTKGKELWTVRHVNTRQGQRGSGWEVEVDAASAKVIRFTSYRGER
jgi:hypothetical protein